MAIGCGERVWPLLWKAVSGQVPVQAQLTSHQRWVQVVLKLASGSVQAQIVKFAGRAAQGDSVAGGGTRSRGRKQAAWQGGGAAAPTVLGIPQLALLCQ